MKIRRLFQGGRPAGVKLLRVGPIQRFSTRLVDQAIMDGWMSVKAGLLTLHTQPQKIHYRVTRTPGIYCCHCGAPQEHGAAAQAHVAQWHAGKLSPDRENPSGYIQCNYYEGRR